jgi:hypothetical protein
MLLKRHAVYQTKPRMDWPGGYSSKIAWRLPRHYILERFESKEVGRSTNRNGRVGKIERENRTDTQLAINFDASLVGFDHGSDQT